MGTKKQYAFSSKVWLYPGMAGWHFLTVPKKESEDIKQKHGKNARGWGSHPIEVTVGESTWHTSIFPDKKSGTYLLPLKAIIRRKEGIDAGDSVKVFLTLR